MVQQFWKPFSRYSVQDLWRVFNSPKRSKGRLKTLLKKECEVRFSSFGSILVRYSVQDLRVSFLSPEGRREKTNSLKESQGIRFQFLEGFHRYSVKILELWRFGWFDVFSSKIFELVFFPLPRGRGKENKLS